MYIFYPLIFTIITLVLYAYYRTQQSKRLEIICKETQSNKNLLSYLRKKVEAYDPPIYLFTGYLKFLMSLRSPEDESTYQRHEITYSDSGTVALDIYPKNSSPRKGEPIVLFYPGINSTSCDAYLARSIKQVHRETGFVVMLVNKRGFLGYPITGSKPMDWVCNQDIDEALDFILDKWHPSGIHLVGMSLGASQIGNYFGKMGKKAHRIVKSGSSISGGHDIKKGINLVKKSWLLDYALLQFTKENFFKNMKYPKFQEYIKERNISIKDLDNISSFSELHQEFIPKYYGTKNLDEYSEKYSSERSMQNIDRPYLCINSVQDLICQ